MRAPTRDLTVVRYLAIVSILVVIALVATIRFEVFENFEAWTRQYEGWRIDEFVFVPFVPAFGLASTTGARWKKLPVKWPLGQFVLASRLEGSRGA